MRRIAPIAATALAGLACALLPSGALAHGHHHGHHHARRHHGRGLHAGLFGASAGNGSQQTDSSGSPGTRGTEDVGPTSGTQQGDAGKIVSFTEGVLEIQLGEGEKATTIVGKVTEETEIHCIPAPTSASTPSPTTPSSSDDDGWSGGAQDQQGQQGEGGWGQNDQGSGDDDQGGENCQCSTANLTPGTIVHRAELLLTESGAVFREIELVH